MNIKKKRERKIIVTRVQEKRNIEQKPTKG